MLFIPPQELKIGMKVLCRKKGYKTVHQKRYVVDYIPALCAVAFSWFKDGMVDFYVDARDWEITDDS